MFDVENELNEDIIENNKSIESEIKSITNQMQQLMRMIEENDKMIAENDDIENRQFLKEQLLIDIAECQTKIDYLNGLPSRAEAIELQDDLEEAYILLYGGNE